MTSFADRIALRDKIDLAVKTTVTYLRKSSNALWWTTDRPISAWYWMLLDQALDTALDIVEELPEDFFEDRREVDLLGLADTLGLDPSDRFNLSDGPLERAEKVVAALRARRERTVSLRKIRALENVTGRTDEEAAAYRAKAAELRESLARRLEKTPPSG